MIDIKVPSPGESVSEVEIAEWKVKDGEIVKKDTILATIDSDKATLEIVAPEGGKVSIQAKTGVAVKVGTVMCKIDESFKGLTLKTKTFSSESFKTNDTKPELGSKPLVNSSETSKSLLNKENLTLKTKRLSAYDFEPKDNQSGKSDIITKQDMINTILSGSKVQQSSHSTVKVIDRTSERKKMSMLRRKISERLVSVKNETAMLTTFNEVDMSKAMEIRKKFKDEFKEKKGINLGFMSFFTKAVTVALEQFPDVNAYIDGDEIVYNKYFDIGVAVSPPKGLMAPIIKNANVMTMAEIELKIKELAIKVRDGKITVDEMTGGTFTITNGGVFGSMLSTPILNPPQSAILGMHNIVERPVAINGKVEIRPIMYVALSYDHRIIDGKDSVSFLYKVKECIENPMRMLISGKDPDKELLGL